MGNPKHETATISKIKILAFSKLKKATVFKLKTITVCRLEAATVSKFEAATVSNLETKLEFQSWYFPELGKDFLPILWSKSSL